MPDWASIKRIEYTRVIELTPCDEIPIHFKSTLLYSVRLDWMIFSSKEAFELTMKKKE